MKVLVIGASGFIGSYLFRAFDAQGTSFSGKSGYIQLDIRKSAKCNEVIRDSAADMVINASGIANVDACEINRKEALEVNGIAVGHIARSSYGIGAYFVQLSTDYVFDGRKGNYAESDKPNPINNYGRTKLIGDKNALKFNGLVLRISSPYGINYAQNKDSFASFVIKKLRSKEEIKIASDQVTTPTYTKEIRNAIMKLSKANAKGIFHLGSRDALSRYDFALKTSKKFNLDSRYITDIKIKELKFKAKRPINTSLKSKKIGEYIKLKSVESNLSDFHKDYLKYGIL
jgi:dTDP-4-dehydrorhamnose reductase